MLFLPKKNKKKTVNESPIRRHINPASRSAYDVTDYLNFLSPDTA